MIFLIRSAFWFSLVLLLMPFRGPDGEMVGPLQTFLAAREAVLDITGLCRRKPEVCVIGRSAFSTIGARAEESARLAYRVLDDRFGDPDPLLETGSVPAPPAAIGEGALADTARAVISDPATAAALVAAISAEASRPQRVAPIGADLPLPTSAPTPTPRR